MAYGFLVTFYTHARRAGVTSLNSWGWHSVCLKIGLPEKELRLNLNLALSKSFLAKLEIVA